MTQRRYEIRWTNSHGRQVSVDTYYDIQDARAAERAGRYKEPGASGWTITTSARTGGESERVGLHA
jgi:hypothetical protein